MRTKLCFKQLVKRDSCVSDGSTTQIASLQVPARTVRESDLPIQQHNDKEQPVVTSIRAYAKMSCSGCTNKKARAASTLSNPGSATSLCTSAGKSVVDTIYQLGMWTLGY